MIRFIFLQNVQGKTRLAKYYVPYEDAEKHKIEYEVHKVVVSRDRKFANFVEVSATDGRPACMRATRPIGGANRTGANRTGRWPTARGLVALKSAFARNPRVALNPRVAKAPVRSVGYRAHP